LKQSKKYRLVGTCPLLMHNGQLADPLNEWAKEIRAITTKRTKTDADHEEIGRLEWMGSLYLLSGAPCVPREVQKATLLRAGMSLKKGPKVKAGIVCEAHAPLLYDGPTDPTALWADGRFTDRRPKAQNRVRIMRTRPSFFPWAIDLLLAFNDEQLNPKEVDAIVTIAGTTIGFGDERPEYGRFTVKKL
jgi:hypothetical protein